MPRACFDQVSDFNRGRMVAYRDGGLFFREIGQQVGRNKAIVMRMCHRWMQKKTMEQRADRTHLIVSLLVMSGGLCAWEWWILQSHHGL
ncbi:hypothetical protein TNCV_2251841 [Trichonephila clavipes]|nr:hypothetical protein TNCV_2251841 [Trichonephila clavipes]